MASAVYQFDNIFVYCHYDGFPKGASAKLYEMLSNPSKGCLATQFVRAVPTAEICDGRIGSHYYYKIATAGRYDATALLEVSNKHYKLSEFIEGHKHLIEDYSPFRQVDGFGWINGVVARRILEHPASIFLNYTNPLNLLGHWIGQDLDPVRKRRFREESAKFLSLLQFDECRHFRQKAMGIEKRDHWTEMLETFQFDGDEEISGADLIEWINERC